MATIRRTRTGLSLWIMRSFENLLPTGSEERGVLGVGSIPVAILPSLSLYENYCIIIA